MTNTKSKPHLRPCGIVDELTGEPLFYYRDLDTEQREAERQAEARKVTRYRIGSAGKLETRRFDAPKWVLAADGWETSEIRARRLHASQLPAPAPIVLVDVIPLPKPRRYKRDEPICGAKTRKGVPCQARGIGKGGRCRNHGGLSTGPRTLKGRQRCLEAVRRRWEAERRRKLDAHSSRTHHGLQG